MFMSTGTSRPMTMLAKSLGPSLGPVSTRMLAAGTPMRRVSMA